MKGILKNIGGNFLIQTLNLLIPLLTIPFLTESLGLKNYGSYAFVLSFCLFVAIFLEFGFSLWGVNEIARLKGGDGISKIYSSVFFIKVIIFFFSFVALNFASYLIEPLEFLLSNYSLAIFFIVSGIGFQCLWVFQGLEEIKYGAIIVLFGKLIFLCTLFLFLKNDGSVELALLLNAVSLNLTAILQMIFIAYIKKIKLLIIGFEEILFVFKSSIDFFVSRFIGATFFLGGTIVLGIFSTAEKVAIYSIAEQIFKACQALVGTVSQAMYPYMARTKDTIIFYKILLVVFIFCCSASIFNLFFGETLIKIMFGSDFKDAFAVLKIFMLSLIVYSVASLYGYPWMAAKNMTRFANKSIIYGALSFVMSISIFVAFSGLSPISVAVSILISEVVILLHRLSWAYLIK